MASDTATKKLEAVRTRVLSALAGAFSGVGLAIVLVNVLSLIVLTVGMLLITENRRELVEAKLVSLQAQAQIVANVITEDAVRGDAPGPRMDDRAARQTMRQLSQLYVTEETRALLYAPGPLRIADSDLILGDVEETVLPPPGARPLPGGGALRAGWNRFEEWLARIGLDAEERERLDRTLADEVAAAFQTGEPQSGIRRDEEGRRIVSATVPIRLIQAVVGTVTYESYDLDALIWAERQALLPYFLAATLVLLISAAILAAWIAGPIRELAERATEIKLAGGRRVDLPDFGRRRDEIGELGRAFTSMTNALYDRLTAIESFAADVSHEIKNPLASIRSASEVLPMAKDETKRARLIEVIQHDVRRLDRLVTDISNASRLDAELARDDLARVDLRKLLDDIAAMQRRGGAADADGGETTITVDAKPGLVVHGHEGPLGRVFLNLVQNAVTFSPPGGTVRVAARRIAQNTRIAIDVEDDGPGIPEESLEAVFERFYTRRPEGAAFGGHSGLGLAIVRQIVIAHGGTVRASNRTGPDGARLGARFTVELPAAR
ncbi:MAG: stimulus-sensing domain-containing protein [Oceanicaulis sp.]